MGVLGFYGPERVRFCGPECVRWRDAGGSFSAVDVFGCFWVVCVGLLCSVVCLVGTRFCLGFFFFFLAD